MKKNLIFIMFLLLIFFISYESYFQEPKDNSLDTLLIKNIQNYTEFFRSFYSEKPLIVMSVISISFLVLTILYAPFIGPFFVLLTSSLIGSIKTILLCSFIITISYTFSFIISKFIINNFIRSRKFDKKMKIVTQSFENDGWVYLLSTRFSGVIPAIVINTAMGLTKIPTWQFYLVTQIGTLPHIIIYSIAGTQILDIKSTRDLISPSFLIIMLVLSISPIILKIIGDYLLKKHNYKKKKTLL